MASRVTARAGDRTHVMRLSSVDDRLMSLFAQSGFCATVYGSRVEARAVSARELCAGARALLAEVRGQWDLLPYRYSTEVRMPVPGGEPLVLRGSGGVNVPMDGKACTLWAGVGECCIEERRMEPDGTWRVVGRVDVRGRQTVEIEGSDPVKIARGKLKSEWPERRGELLALLAAAGR